MNTVALPLLKVALSVTVFGYWYLAFELIDKILERPRLKKWVRTLVCIANMLATVGFMHLSKGTALPIAVILLLMLLEFSFLYRDSAVKALFCALACIIHVMAIHAAVLGGFSLVMGKSIYSISYDGALFLASETIVFVLLCFAIAAVQRFISFEAVRILGNHKEHRWFMIAWMSVNNIYLFINAVTLDTSGAYQLLTINQVIAPIAILIGLYIVLFFAFETCRLLGYQEKTAVLEQTVAQELQYRNSVTKDAIATYEINVTQDLLLHGLVDDTDEILVQMNRRYSDILAFRVHQMIYSEDVDGFLRYGAVSRLSLDYERGRSEISTEYRRLLPDGTYIWVRAVTNLIQDLETGDVIAYVCVRNIDAEKRRQITLQEKAERDPLTGLYNKEITGKRINEHLSYLHDGDSAAMFMIDVDCFKSVNDHLGHVYGDAVLCELADKLRALFRSDDIVGRIGGDEFIVYLKQCPSTERLREKAQETLKVFQREYRGAKAENYAISGSIGIALSPADGESFERLYQHADAALYQAKNLGKNTYVFYDGSDFIGYTAQRTEIDAVGAAQQRSFRSNRIEYVFKMLYNSDNQVSAIRSVLELVASHFAFERGYIFETSKDGRTTSNTFEWCAEGVSPQIDNLQNVPIACIKTANKNFLKNGSFVLKNLDDLEPMERDVLKPQGIKSMYQFGIFDRCNLLGLVGFDNCRSETLPGGVEIDEIATICNILSTFFVKQYLDDLQEKELTIFQDIMNNLENYIYVIDMQTFEVLFMNEKTRKLMQANGSTEPCYRFFRGCDCQCTDCPARGLGENGAQRTVIESFNDKLGVWMEITATPLRWRDGSITALINCADITKQKEEHRMHINQLEKMAYVDEVTGGRSYYKFKEDAQRILEQDSGCDHLLVKLDIDNFKLFNQMSGRAKGDEVLCAVEEALTRTARGADDICARIVNDEFIALFALYDPLDQASLYDVFLQHFTDIMGQKYVFKFNFPHGRLLVPTGNAAEIDISEIFENVNMAHKAAKQDRTKQFVLYNQSITQEAMGKKEIENKMENALENNEFQVYFQPKYHLADETIGGLEALVRWQSENGELFYPDTFIPLFEKNGFITKLDFYMLQHVCAILQDWFARGFATLVVSVNFSRLHLGNPCFVEDLCKVVDSYGVRRQCIEIEITETVIYDNIETLEILLADLHAAGFTMSMDDFGSGYSSLGMLKNLPVDVIKMDRSFFANPKDEARSNVVVGSVIAMAESLGIHTVAEGVETQEQIDLLRKLHCGMAQGYFFEKPMPAQAMERLLAR